MPGPAIVRGADEHRAATSVAAVARAEDEDAPLADVADRHRRKTLGHGFLLPGRDRSRSLDGGRTGVGRGCQGNRAVVKDRAIGDAADDQSRSGHAGGIAKQPGSAMGASSADDALPVHVVAVLGDDRVALAFKELFDGIAVDVAHRVASSRTAMIARASCRSRLIVPSDLPRWLATCVTGRSAK